MKKEKLLKSAIGYRKKGYSLREISEKINISKSTASQWLSKVRMSKEGIDRMRLLKSKAIDKSKEVRKKQKKKYLKNISASCTVLRDGVKYSKNDLKIFLALLFWGEGSKNDRRLIFMNSDPEMIKTYLILLRNSFPVSEKKFRAILHLHSYHDTNTQKVYWAKITKIDIKHISIYKKYNSGKRIREGYEGCISIRYGDVKILDELMLIIERLKKYFIAGVG